MQLRALLVASVLAAGALPAQSAAPDTRTAPLLAVDGLSLTDWIARSTVVVAGNNFNDVLYQTPKGAGFDAVGALFIERSDGNYLCTGALLAGGLNVLTAAHCLANEDGVNVTQQVTAVFFTPGQPASVREFITSNATYVNPAYTGEVIDAHDVAVVHLGSAPSQGIRNAAYTLFTGNPFQVGQFVGSGATGTGLTGMTQDGGFTLGDRRTARNTIDFTWTDPGFDGFFYNFFGNADPNTLVADFDSGLSANNSSCILTGFFCGLGQGAFEGGLGSGDSGGPLFINGQIAGVASYNLSFGRSLGDTDNLLNGTFGEFSGWTSTSLNAAWITTVPEPGSFALMGFGLVVFAGVAQHRRTRPSAGALRS